MRFPARKRKGDRINKTMQVIGQIDTSGREVKYKQAVDVTRFGDTLRDEDGFVWAIKDEYKDWVSPTLYKYGIKSKMLVKR